MKIKFRDSINHQKVNVVVTCIMKNSCVLDLDIEQYKKSRLKLTITLLVNLYGRLKLDDVTGN